MWLPFTIQEYKQSMENVICFIFSKSIFKRMDFSQNTEEDIIQMYL